MALDRMPLRNERGIALLMTLIVLFVLAAVALAILTNVQSETKVTSHGLRTAEAYNNSLAGIGEAISTLRAGNGPQDPNQPKAVAQVVLLAPGSTMPTYGTTDTTGLPTQQPVGSYLNYSTTTKGPDALTIAFKTDPGRTVVYKYDPSLSPPINTVSGYPIYVITSTGTAGGDRRRIVTEVVQKPVIVNAKGALAANVGIDFKGTFDVCGYNHRVDTPSGTGGEHPGGPCVAYEVGNGDLAGAWSTGAVTTGGAAGEGGVPPMSSNQTGFYAGPWEMLGMSQSEFFSWVGPPVTSIPSNANGVYYVDNDNIAQNQSISFGGNGGAGEGLLYIDGDAHFNGGFVWRGLVYIEGDFDMNGHAWILGAVVVRGRATIKANGTGQILYSKDAIVQNIARAGSYLTLSWKESNN